MVRVQVTPLLRSPAVEQALQFAASTVGSGQIFGLAVFGRPSQYRLAP